MGTRAPARPRARIPLPVNPSAVPVSPINMRAGGINYPKSAGYWGIRKASTASAHPSAYLDCARIHDRPTAASYRGDVVAAVQNSPPHNAWLSRFAYAERSRAVILLNTRTCSGRHLRGAEHKRWM